MFFLFADDEVKTNDLELYFCKVFRYKWFCKKLYFRYWNLFIRKDLLERYLLERIKSLVGHVQFMVAQKHNLVRHLILPQVFPVGQNVRRVFRLVRQILISVRHDPMSNRYFKACNVFDFILWSVPVKQINWWSKIPTSIKPQCETFCLEMHA